MNATFSLDMVRSLSPEQKESVFLELLREMVRINGDSEPIPIDDEAGNFLGSYVPHRASPNDTPPKLTPEREAEFARRQAERGRFLSEAEFLDWVTQVEPAQSQ